METLSLPHAGQITLSWLSFSCWSQPSLPTQTQKTYRDIKSICLKLMLLAFVHSTPLTKVSSPCSHLQGTYLWISSYSSTSGNLMHQNKPIHSCYPSYPSNKLWHPENRDTDSNLVLAYALWHPQLWKQATLPQLNAIQNHFVAMPKKQDAVVLQLN